MSHAVPHPDEGAEGERIRFCPACGEAVPYARPDCRHCGHRVELPAGADAAREQAPCPECGRERLATLIHCPHCGVAAGVGGRAIQAIATSGTADEAAASLARLMAGLALLAPLLAAAAVLFALGGDVG